MENNELERLVAPELEAMGFEVVLCEVVGSSSNPIVRLYVDKPGGVSVGDCGMVSRTVSMVLEREDPFPGRYLLEVSSPGSSRPLRTEDHFTQFVGQAAKLQITAPDERKMTYTGTIRSCINGVITLDTADGEVTVGIADVTKASLVQQEYKIDKKRDKPRRRKGRAAKRKGDEK